MKMQTERSDKLLRAPAEVVFAEGEVWWGGCAADGMAMPYTAASKHEASLGVDQRGNQAAPFLVSSQGSYLWSDAPFSFSFESGRLKLTGTTAPLQFSSRHGSLKEAFLDAARRHFPPAQTLPPEAFFTKPQYNTWIELNHSQTQEGVLRYARGLINAGFPPGLLMIDAGWDDYWGKLDFHNGRFPDAVGMISELHDLGFLVMLWLSPFISPDSLEFRAWRGDRGMLLRQADGSPAILQWWDGHSAHLDVTDPCALSWLSEKLAMLQKKYGVDGFKFDAGDTATYRNRPYSLLHATPAELTEAWAAFGCAYPFNEYRACWKMAGQPLIQRLSDRLPEWGACGLQSLIPNGLAQGLIGHPFICPDMIGGGEYLAYHRPEFQIDEEMFVRSAQASALFPMMQFSASPARVLSPKAKALCIEAVALHTKLAPTILRCAEESARTGEPIIRPIEWNYPHAGYAEVKDQFLLGDRILAAPVLAKGAQVRKVQFPPGTWQSEDGSLVEGPCTREVPVSLASIPLYHLQG